MDLNHGGGVDSDAVPVTVGTSIDIGDNDQGAQTTNSDGKHAVKDVKGGVAKEASKELSKKHADANSEVKSEADIISMETATVSPPKTVEETLRPYLNLRTTVICLWVIQTSIVATISAHPQASELHRTQPKALAFSMTFIATGRLLLVPCLFFLSGFQLSWNLSLKYIWCVYARRMAWTLFTVVCLLWVKLAAEHLYGTVKDTKNGSVPYYATEEGRDALLNGPIFFSYAVLALDFSVLFIKIINSFTFGYKITTITDVKHYSKILKWIILPLMVWIQLLVGAICLIGLPEDIQRLISAANSADLHFLILYPIAYYTGTLLPCYIEVLLVKHKNMCGQGRIELVFVFSLLTTVSAYFPHIIPSTLDPRTQPVLEFEDRTPEGHRLLDLELAYIAYTLWAYVTLGVVPKYILAAINYRPYFSKRSWGRFSRYANVQIGYLMIVAISPGSGVNRVIPVYIENIFLQGIIGEVRVDNYG